MVRPYRPKDEYYSGELVVEQHPNKDFVTVYYLPCQWILDVLEVKFDEEISHKVKLLEIDNESGKITIFPTNTTNNNGNLLGPKYGKIRCISLEGGRSVLRELDQDDRSATKYKQAMSLGSRKTVSIKVDRNDIVQEPMSEEDVLDLLEELPPTFTKDYDYGLGLAKQYRFIVHAIEELTDCTEILISEENTKIVEPGDVFQINNGDFEILRKMLNSTTRMREVAERTVKSTEMFNYIADLLGHPKRTMKYGRNRLRKFFTREIQNDHENLSNSEQNIVIEVLTSNIRSISEKRPEKLSELRNDLDLINLETLTERFREMLERNCKESDWQKFFAANHFILSMAFGVPIVVIDEQVSIGGRDIHGRGEKISDFLVKNNMTNNAAIVEIKTPSSKLLNRGEFRGGVFSPSSDLSGAITQVLDQKYQFERDIFRLKDNSDLHDLQTYSVRCFLVFGTMPTNANEVKSFELYRGNLSFIEVITFDELLEKLISIKEFLKPKNEVGKEQFEGSDETHDILF